MRSREIGLFFVILLLAGCAATTVRKDPGPHDNGFRFYRPKPYLLVEQVYVKDGSAQAGFYKISVQYLPDFSEEYSLHIHAGLGSNNTTATFDSGWKLTGLTVDVDSKTPENIGAVANLLKGVKTFVKTGPDGKAEDIIVEGANVPLGFYEPVVSRNAKRDKRLYGWRYVGFIPFQACPLELGGKDTQPCSANDVYALIMEQNVMVFRKLSEAGVPLEAFKDPQTVSANEFGPRADALRNGILSETAKRGWSLDAKDITITQKAYTMPISIRVKNLDPGTQAQKTTEIAELVRTSIQRDLILGGFRPTVQLLNKQ